MPFFCEMATMDLPPFRHCYHLRGKGMKETQWFYRTNAWRQVREQKYKQAKGLCEDCLKRGIVKPGEEVHHVIWLTPQNVNDPSISLNLDNLVLLCKECHEARHKKQKRYRVDEYGRVSPICEKG